MPRALNREGCASSPTTTVIGGAPNSPSDSTSQPSRASTSWRAAASATKFATVAPVTKATSDEAGRPRSSSSQRRATDSSVAPIGDATTRPAGWSQAAASQFAATVTGSEPPMTKPKKRRPAVPRVAGDPTSSRSARVSRGSTGRRGSGSSSRVSPSSASSEGATARS